MIFGCGYVGRVLARRLVERGDPLRATTTTEAKLTELAALGAEPVLLDAQRPETYAGALHDAEAIVHLAPPPKEESTNDQVARIAGACSASLRTYVYGSTTGAFGNQGDHDTWIDESTPPRNLGERGQARLDYEHALERAGLPVRVVRIPGIYGPGRTLRHALERQSIVLFEGGPPTSRVHVEDLAHLLEAMLRPGAPPLVVGCDDKPAPTLEVARYTCELIGVELPAPVPLEDAKRVLSPAALEMRMHGRRCRSLVREKLIGPLAFPTYVEGVRASLIAEGALKS